MPESPIQIIRLYEQSPERAVFGPYRVLPGLTREQIEAAEAEEGREFPRSLRNLMYQCGGLEFEHTRMHWEFGGDLNGLFPGAIHLMNDGSGNYWSMDVAQNPERLGPIFFYSHDPAVIVYQAHDLSDFLERILSGKELAETDSDIWRKGAAGGKRDGDWIVFDLSDEKIGAGAPVSLYYGEIFGLQREGNSLKFRIKHRKRNWWQRFRDSWR